MSKVYALIPARKGSKGIPGKNWRYLGTQILWTYATQCAREAGCDGIYVSTDMEAAQFLSAGPGYDMLYAPAPLHTDTCPMIDVVQDALHRVPGDPSDIFVLLQPTQPFRTPEHVKLAITLLRKHNADSVVSVVQLPLTHHPRMQIEERGGKLYPFYQGTDHEIDDDEPRHWKRRERHWGWALPATRQELRQTYKRDGTVYAFWRKTVEQHGTIYGTHVHPLFVSNDDTCALDTLEDWASVEARWTTKTQESYATQGK